MASAVLVTIAASVCLSSPSAADSARSADGLATCGLARIDDQLVSCDNLTGAGTSALPAVPEQLGAGTISPGCQRISRIGDQLLWCDNLTGAGAAAPAAVPEQLGTAFDEIPD
jgi:hypothetical protein